MGALFTVTALLFAWSIVSGRVERLDVTGPIVFVIAGLVLCNGPTGIIDLTIETSTVQLVVELTLAVLLFADAVRVDPAHLRAGAGLPIRLLVIGLPLTFAAGFGLAAVLFTNLPWELAALLGAVLAPTDAALSAAVLANPEVPEDIRRSLNVESGLNDGIATPAATTLVAASATVLGTGVLPDTASGPGLQALIGIVGGAGIGVFIGYLGGRCIARAHGAGWIEPGGRRIAVLMLALGSFALAAQIDVNYFVAAFVAGLALRAAMGADDPEVTELPELIGRMLSLVVWFLFGAFLLLAGLKTADSRIFLYAVLSLTIIRMVPVAIAMARSGADRATVLFVGWFGPRGLASVVFGLLIIEELPADDPQVRTVISTIAATVALSVVAHGLSGRPLSARIGQRRRRAA